MTDTDSLPFTLSMSKDRRHVVCPFMIRQARILTHMERFLLVRAVSRCVGAAGAVVIGLRRRRALAGDVAARIGPE